MFIEKLTLWPAWQALTGEGKEEKRETGKRRGRRGISPFLLSVLYSTVSNFINSPQGLFRANLPLKKKKTKIKLTCNIIPHVNDLS